MQNLGKTKIRITLPEGPDLVYEHDNSDSLRNFVTNDFGNNLKKYREKMNLTQKEFANQLKLCPSTISRYETNRQKPTFENFKQIISFTASL